MRPFGDGDREIVNIITNSIAVVAYCIVHVQINVHFITLAVIVITR